MNNWKLEIEFDSIPVQVERDPENAFPNDEQTRFIHFLGQHWDMLSDDFQDNSLFEWAGDRITIFSDVLDPLADVLEWLLMSTIPKKVELTR